ncbi:MAG: DNA repair protein RadA, partial [Pseudomonadota bacterium]
LVYICDACRGETPKWQGQCPHCGEWNTLVSRSVSAQPRGGTRVAARSQPLVASAGAAPLSVVGQSAANPAGSGPEPARWSMGMGELDRVLGGGIVPGSVTLIGGEPGIGKSTLLLQVAAQVGATRPVLYVSGEESGAQIAMRARRLGLATAGVKAACETDLDSVLALAAEERVAMLVIDSIQTMSVAASDTSAGSVSQLRECTAALVRFAKTSDVAVLIVGHVTKEGAIAGPRMVEHLVDTVLYFERDAGSRFRMVRAAKNRFGSVNELGFFLMTEQGLREVRNPAAIFLSRTPEPVVGSVVMVTRDGTRPLLVEVQGLVDRMRFGAPRRVTQGIDAGRLAMLLAVLNRHAGVSLQEHDVFANVVGGLDIDEPAWDLPVAIALASSLRDVLLPASLIVFGEVGLTGEVRPVTFGEERIREAAKQGFTTAIVPRDNAPRVVVPGITVLPVARIDEALRAALGAGSATAAGAAHTPQRPL